MVLICARTGVMDGVSTSSSEARDAVLRYEAFLNDVLKRDLALVQARREREEEALEAYAKLKGEAARFEAIARGGGRVVRSLVDVGCEVYAQAEVDVAVRARRLPRTATHRRGGRVLPARPRRGGYAPGTPAHARVLLAPPRRGRVHGATGSAASGRPRRGGARRAPAGPCPPSRLPVETVCPAAPTQTSAAGGGPGRTSRGGVVLIAAPAR